ncbi:hypothetical protein C0J52_11691 [Blattella germanica]|nr:hypothetical protein C0J52_11691 [Blattella germanica]
MTFVSFRNEKANDNYNTDFVYRLYTEEGKGLFSARQNILGHMQQGGSPTSFDRNMGTKMASKAVDGLIEQVKLAERRPDGSVYINTPESAVMMGVIRRQYKLTPLEDLVPDTDFENELSNIQEISGPVIVITICSRQGQSATESQQSLPRRGIVLTRTGRPSVVPAPFSHEKTQELVKMFGLDQGDAEEISIAPADKITLTSDEEALMPGESIQQQLPDVAEEEYAVGEEDDAEKCAIECRCPNSDNPAEPVPTKPDIPVEVVDVGQTILAEEPGLPKPTVEFALDVPAEPSEIGGEFTADVPEEPSDVGERFAMDVPSEGYAAKYKGWKGTKIELNLHIQSVQPVCGIPVKSAAPPQKQIEPKVSEKIEYAVGEEDDAEKCAIDCRCPNSDNPAEPVPTKPDIPVECGIPPPPTVPAESDVCSIHEPPAESDVCSIHEPPAECVTECHCRDPQN